jgi:hypothetical protein
MAAMDLELALRDLAETLAAGRSARDRLQAARRIAVRECLSALRIEPAPQHSLPAVIRLALASPDQAARRDCAVLLLHALAVPNLIPAATHGDLGALAESALRAALLRSGYPFGGALDERIRVLARLHTSITELLKPLEPTFPNWPGLYAG